MDRADLEATVHRAVYEALREVEDGALEDLRPEQLKAAERASEELLRALSGLLEE